MPKLQKPKALQPGDTLGIVALSTPITVRLSLLILVFTLFAPAAARAYVDETQKNEILFSEYRPIYMLFGSPYTKIEVSFKARLVRSAPIYFGYNQLMMWRLFTSNPYFRDLNYDPEVFYRLSLPGRDSWLDLSPFEHESNGKGYGHEVSWDRAYARYQWLGGLGGESRLVWNAKVWVPYLDSRNSNIARYLGLGELTVTLTDVLGGSWKKSDLSLRVYLGGASYVNPLQGGQELTLRVRPYPSTAPITLQLFHGYGENLLDYQENRLAFRVGLGL